MKNKEQQMLCEAMDEFRKNQGAKTFQTVLESLFLCPLVFPQGKGEQKGQFMLAQKEDQKVLVAFSDREEAEKGNFGDVDYTTLTIEEYAQVMSQVDAVGLGINLFHSSCCILNKRFFAEVVVPAFKEKRIMPGLKCVETGEYIPVNKMPFSIGRSPQSDLVIADNGINAQHALLIERKGSYYVVDRDSLNGVYVNGKKVEKECELEFDDVLEFSDVEYEFLPLGLAERKSPQTSAYGADLHMIANAVFFMQNNILVKEFLTNYDAFISEIEQGDTKEMYCKYFLIALETTCKVKEQEWKDVDETAREDQRKAMLGRGASFIREQAGKITKQEQENGCVYQVDFPESLYIPGLARRIYLVTAEDGNRAAFVIRIMQEKVFVVKVGMDNQETNCGEAPATAEEELDMILKIGI